ncbi:MAG: PhzF family phenazine biosynthesis protein [Rhodospirillales bacterium]|nr:PhzF family phenazine biosynthesis protein [Rhodospirillales bacterium]
MVTVPIYQVDAFTDVVFSGNPAAVCVLDKWLDDDVMQNVAAENNLAETAFVVPSSGEIADYDLRWFTPTQEVDLCGHATLATASILLSHRDPGRSKVMFATRSGNLIVRRADVGYEMELPCYPPVGANIPAGLSQAIGVKPEAFLRTSNEEGMNLAILEAADQVRSADPDLEFIKNMPGDGLIISAPGDTVDACDFVSRYFAPHAGIPEDPVTGSAHCVLAPYWAARLGKVTLSARQVSRRGGALTCRLDGDRVILGGNTILYLEGTIIL